MSDIKLYKVGTEETAQIASNATQIEKSLQKLFEANLEVLLGIRFLSTEHSTGPVHGGRIDTLGLDEDGSPVIIEYKRAVNENVINQGLYYLDWLMDHRKDFQWLVMEKLGPDVAKTVEWTAPRLVCIAGDFTRYDEHAVKQINRNIELLRYRRFGDDLLMIELVHAPKVAKPLTLVDQASSTVSASKEVTPEPSLSISDNPADPYANQRISYRIANSPPALRDLFDSVSDFLTNLGDDVQVKEVKYYVAFKRIKNFACLEVYPKAKTVTIYLKIDPDTVALEPGFLRDVRKVGHYGTGDVEVSIRDQESFTRAQPMIIRAYEGN